MSSKKTVLFLAIVLLAFSVFAFSITQSHSSVRDDVKVYIWNPETASNVYPALAYPTVTLVEVWIDTPDAWYDTANGIVGVTVGLHVDPSVVEVLTASAFPDLDLGGFPDSFLGDFLEDAHPWDGYNTFFASGTVDEPSGNITETAEIILGFTTLGLGAGGGPKPLWRWVIRTQWGVDETTAYSALTLFDARYTVIDPIIGSGVTYPVEIVESGHYGEPSTPPEALEELTETIEAWDLPKGTENSLTTKLEGALHLLDIGNENGAMHKLMDFINQVEAQRGKKLTDDQADFLVAEAQRILSLIEG